MQKLEFLIILIFGFFSLCFAADEGETLTITTYYPSPYGSYRQLTADQIAIGSAYRNPTYADGSLYVQGNVGIGTTAPVAKLDVSGGVKVANDTGVCNASKAGTIRWTGTALQGCTGIAWAKIVGAGGGTSQADAGRTFKTILDNGLSTGSGIYWIDPDNDGNTSNAFQAYCDMVNQDGGWTLVVGIEANANHVNPAAVTPGNLTSPTGKGKYSDATINQIKLGASPAYRFTCASVTGYFQTSCTFATTTVASGVCAAEAYTYPPSSYGTVQYSQPDNRTLADGSSGPADRLIYGNPGYPGCDTAPTSWGQSGTVYVR